MNLSLIGEQIAGLDSFLINQKADLTERRQLVAQKKSDLVENIQRDRNEFQIAIDVRRESMINHINSQFKDLAEWLDQELTRNQMAVSAAFDEMIASIDHQIVTVQATRGEDLKQAA